MLQQNASFDTVTRGAIRAFGSAESPIALGALFAIMTPLSLYLAIRFGRWWWPSAVVLMGGAFATVSRTAIVMLFVSGLVVLVLRFRETWRYAPLLLIPMVVVVHFAVPGALGAMKNAFAPPGGLINEHKGLWNGPTQDEYVYRSAFPDREAEIGVGEEEAGSGRLADIGPSLELFRMKPVFGYGYGTLQPLGPDANTRIVDNQWLSSLLNVGLVGVLALAWLFIRFVRGVGTWAFQERTDDGWLLVALVASVAAFGVGMFTLDSFAFTQVTFVFFVILGLGSALALAPDPVPAPSFETSPAPARPSRIRLGRQPALSAE
jgi:hypothetical protein